MNWTEAKALGMTYDEYRQTKVDEYLSPTQQAAIFDGIKRTKENGREFRTKDAFFIAYGEPLVEMTTAEFNEDLMSRQDRNPRYMAVLRYLGLLWSQGKVNKHPHKYSFYAIEEE